MVANSRKVMPAATKAFTTVGTEIRDRRPRLFSLNTVASVLSLFRIGFHIEVSGWGRQEGTGVGAWRSARAIRLWRWAHTHASGHIRPDLLPSGLYRRLRSFTGSWGLQAVRALSADIRGRFALARALRTTPRGLYRRLGIGKARNSFLPSPCPEGRVISWKS